MVRWGLIPGWADDPSIGNRLANARGDTVAVKPSFRSAFKHRRGILLADGFYEWQVVPGQKVKQPWWIGLPDGGPFGMAAIWERWNPRGGGGPAASGGGDSGAGSHALIESACLITTEPNAVMVPIHNRMPVILNPADYETWLNPHTPLPILQTLLQPFAGTMRALRVSTHVNSPRNEGAACVEPVAG
jgi:putative SOS response-associated peptidase YedK